MRTGKKIIFNTPLDKFKIYGGCILNSKDPNSVFLKFTSWVTYDGDINTVIKTIKDKLKKIFYFNDVVRHHFKSNPIIDLKISESRLVLGRPTFFDLDITLHQKDDEDVRLPLIRLKNEKGDCLKNKLEIIVNEIVINDILNITDLVYHYSIKEGDNYLLLNKIKEEVK